MNLPRNTNDFEDQNQGSNCLMNENGYIYRPSAVLISEPVSYETTGTTSSADNIFLPLSFNDEDDEVHHPSQKFKQLQTQVQVLTQAQISQDERYKRSKHENDRLLVKIHNLEDQIRELELNSEISAKKDDKRHREQIAKQTMALSREYEKHLHANFLLQQDLYQLKNDLLKNDAIIKALKSEKAQLKVELEEKNGELALMNEEMLKLKLREKQLKEEESVKTNIISILNEELESAGSQSEYNNNRFHSSGSVCNSSESSRKGHEQQLINNNHYDDNCQAKQEFNYSPTAIAKSYNTKTGNGSSVSITVAARAIEELESNLREINDENSALKESNEELQTQLLGMQLDEGMSLVKEGNKSYSLADEIGDVDVGQLLKALKEQQDDNKRLCKYIDDILLKIVEKNPELLDRSLSTNSKH